MKGISRLQFEDGKILMRIANSTLYYEIKSTDWWLLILQGIGISLL